ncbi:MAG: hypothetical protein JXA69_08370 [Phycisphaerae bacterium]|nr:hypothetical protein [Phycisphaerae bacterium]
MRYFTIPQVAGLLRVTQDQVHDWINKGSLQTGHVQGQPTVIMGKDFDKFLKNGFEPAQFFPIRTDEDRARAAVRRLYAAIGCPEPSVVFVRSPLVLRLAYAMAALRTGLPEDQFGVEADVFRLLLETAEKPLVKSHIVDPLDPRTRGYVSASTGAPVRLPKTHPAVDWSTYRAWVSRVVAPANAFADRGVEVLGEVQGSVETSESVHDQVRLAVDQAIGETYPRNTTYRKAVGPYLSYWQADVVFFNGTPPWEVAIPSAMGMYLSEVEMERWDKEVQKARAKYEPYRGRVFYRELDGVFSRYQGRFGYLCTLIGCQAVPQLDPATRSLLRDLEELALSAAYWWMHPRFVMIAEPPAEIHWDVSGRLHNEEGPAIVFRDGWTWSVINRTFVPTWLVTTPAEQIDPRRIRQIGNAQVRAEFVRKVGIERICYTLKAEAIDKQGDYELLELDLGDSRRRPFLKMLNPSVPELWHVEGVDPSCKTVAEALAWRNGSSRIPENLT